MDLQGLLMDESDRELRPPTPPFPTELWGLSHRFVAKKFWKKVRRANASLDAC